jgi:hypothetical protein
VAQVFKGLLKDGITQVRVRVRVRVRVVKRWYNTGKG